MTGVAVGGLEAIQRQVVACRRCPRLVAWREQSAREKVRRFVHEEYWGRPVPGFGDPRARLVLVGLAPAAHGGNRTGRMFTGDRSGDWLFRALFRAGFANQPSSERRGDGLILTDCYVTATARCAPPQNILLQDEIKTCRRFLLQELESLPRLRVIVGLGGIGFRAVVESLDALKKVTFGKRPAFAHGAAYRSGGITLIASYHPSQQNTFTGRLTERMFDRVFLLARRRLDAAGKDLQEGTSL